MISASVMACMECRSLETCRAAAIIRRFLLNGTTLYPRFLFNTTPPRLVGRHLIARQGMALLGLGRARFISLGWRTAT